MVKLTIRHLLAFSVIVFAYTCAYATIPNGIVQELLQQLKKDVPDVLDCEAERRLPFNAQEIHLPVDGSLQGCVAVRLRDNLSHA